MRSLTFYVYLVLQVSKLVEGNINTALLLTVNLKQNASVASKMNFIDHKFAEETRKYEREEWSMMSQIHESRADITHR